jgi:hypothetical protein
MAKVSGYTAHTGALLATGDIFYIIDISDGTSGSQSLTVAEALIGFPRLGFNPATIGIMKVNGTAQWNWDDGSIYPETDDDVDLGKTAQQFKDGYFDGTLYCDAFDLNGTAVTSTAAELNYLDITTLGTGAASKAVVLDGSGDYTFPATATIVMPSGGDFTLQSGSTLDVAGTFEIANVAMTASAAELNYLDITTLGTGAASKAVVLDAGDDYTWPATGVLTYGVLNDGTTALAATALEINRTCDVSTRLVSVGGASLAVTVALHDGKIIKLDHTAAESTCTLPAATGTGAVFRFIVSAVNTNNHIIKVTTDDTIDGTIFMLDNDSNAATAYAATGTDDTLTLNGTTTGGQIGDWVEFVDLATDQWAVRGTLMVPAGSNVADPWSATVA